MKVIFIQGFESAALNIKRFLRFSFYPEKGKLWQKN